MLKKVIGMLAAILLFLSISPTYAAKIKDNPRVAVMNFGNKAITSSGLREHDFSSATEYAIYQLSACGWFDLVDYEQLSTMAKIHSVNMSGLVDPTTAVSMGKFLGAQFMVIGNVTGLTTKENVFDYQHGTKGSNAQHVVTANVAMRIVDIETGRIVVAGLGKGSSTSTHTEIVFRKYRNNQNNLAYLPSGDTADGYGGGADEDETAASSQSETIANEGESGTDNPSAETYPEETSTSVNEPVAEDTSNPLSEGNPEEYKITIGTVQVSDVQVRNAISKAVRDAIYGKMGLMTTLNNGKPLKIKTGF